ncbi:MAG: ABC transporter ATP-binding protein [Planctomycetes bacterium]|nr:ABC transporter ATP-binding protein [Planctomycetota bacterium]
MTVHHSPISSPPQRGASESGSTILLLDQLRKSYHVGTTELQVLRGIDLAVESGEHIAIMGPSGSGKSTLLNILGCLDRPTQGRYILGGDDVSQLEDDELSLIRGARIGFIFQSFNLIEQLNIVENIEVPMYYQGWHERESIERAKELAAMVGLGHRIKHHPSELSGGERQRVAIARALSNDPLILLADEPTGNLDSENGAAILKLLLSLHDQGKTLIVVTHDLSVAKRAEKIVHILDGRVKEITVN